MRYETIKMLMPEGYETRLKTLRVEKAMRDARILRERARLVIVLDRDHGGDVCCREIIDNSGDYIADVIAVLAPVPLFEGRFMLDQGIVLEIGMSRGRPYRQAETWESPSSPGQKRCIKGRRRLREATLEEVRVAWPHIKEHLSARTKKRMDERQENQFVIHGGTYIHEDGIRITVSKEDTVMYYKIVVEDARARQERYLSHRARWIVSQLWPHRFDKTRGKDFKILKRFKQLKAVENVAGAFINMRRFTYAPNHVMRSLVKAVSPDVREVFEEALEAHGLSDMANLAHREPKLPPGVLLARQLPYLEGSCFWIVRKQGSQPQRRGRHRRAPFGPPLKAKQAPHAQGCVVAEYYLKAAF